MVNKFIFITVSCCILLSIILYEISLANTSNRYKSFHSSLQSHIRNVSSLNVSDTEIQRIIAATKKTKYPEMIFAIIQQESTFNPRAKSYMGAKGLGQITSVHYKDLMKKGIIKSKNDIWIIENNIKAIEHVYGSYLKQSNGNVSRALSRYYGATSSKYVKSVMSKYNYYNKLKKME